MVCSGVVAQLPPLLGSGKQAAPAVPAELASPRAAVRTFLDGMNDSRIGDALAALDLSEISALDRSQRGPQLAFQLWAVLNRQVFVEYDKISDSADAEPYIIPITDESKTRVGEVAVAKGADGAFRFTASTLSNLPRIWDSVKDKPVIRGLDDPSVAKFDPAEFLESRVPESTKDRVLGVAIWKWLFLGVLLVLATIIAWIIRFITQVLARRILRLEKTDEAYRDIVRGGFGFSIFILGLLVLRNYGYLGLPDPLSGFVGFGSHVAIAIGLVLLAFAIWEGVVDLYARRAADQSQTTERLVAPVITRLGKAVIVVIAGISMLTVVGVNVTGFVATLGIGGLIIALAAKDSVENLFGSVMVLIEKPFRIGDWIKIGDVNGEVEEIRLRSTRIRTFEDSVIVLPNSALVTQSVENYGMRRFRRLKTTIGVTYDTPPERLAQFTERIRQMLLEHPHVWDDKRYVYFNDFSASSLNILLYCFVIASTWQHELEIRDDILLRIVRIAEEMEVDFAFPTQTLHVKNDAAALFGGPSNTGEPQSK